MISEKDELTLAVVASIAAQAHFGEGANDFTAPAQAGQAETLVAALPEPGPAFAPLSWAEETLASVEYTPSEAEARDADYTLANKGSADFQASSDATSSTLLQVHAETLGTIGQSLNSQSAMQPLGLEPVIVEASAPAFVAAAAMPTAPFALAVNDSQPPPPPSNLLTLSPEPHHIITDNPVDALTFVRNGYPDARWNRGDDVGTHVTITYSFLTKLPDYYKDLAKYGNYASSFTPFTTMQKAAVEKILEAYENVANVTFVPVSGVGDITFANCDMSSGTLAHAYRPDSHSSGGDVWCNTMYKDYKDDLMNSWQPGGEMYHAVIHELGHAMGLKHPHNDWDVDETYLLSSNLNNTWYTNMSYAFNGSGAYIDTINGDIKMALLYPGYLQELDIVALQYLYGANTKKVDTTYSWPDRPIMQDTIWDGGGNDTIDCSNQTYDCIINLQVDTFSSIGYSKYDGSAGRDNVAIAKGTVIENATGGSGNDTITGNAVANVLRGGAGDDSLYGGAGNDTLRGDAGIDQLYGGDGKDYLNGGAGADVMVGGRGDDTYVVDNTGDQVLEDPDAGTDKVRSSIDYILPDNVENLELVGTGNINGKGNSLDNVITGTDGANELRGGAGNDRLEGGIGSDKLYGDLGNDTLIGGRDRDYLYGGDGDDYLSGGAGNDMLYGNADNDVLFGGEGNDSLEGGAGNDTLYGEAGDDTLYGGADRDYLYGGDGDDYLSGDAGNDMLYGDAGNDSLDGGAGNDSLEGGQGTDTLSGGAGNDTLIGGADKDYLYGGDGDDYLSGGAGNDVLYGNAGNDTLKGGAGIDKLYGGAGADNLTGGDGADLFFYTQVSDSALTARDRITDFVRGSDKLDFSLFDANTVDNGVQHFKFINGSSFTAVAQLLFSYNADTDTGIVYGNVNNDTKSDFAIYLSGITALTADDFILA